MSRNFWLELTMPPAPSTTRIPSAVDSRVAASSENDARLTLAPARRDPRRARPGVRPSRATGPRRRARRRVPAAPYTTRSPRTVPVVAAERHPDAGVQGVADRSPRHVRRPATLQRHRARRGAGDPDQRLRERPQRLVQTLADGDPLQHVGLLLDQELGDLALGDVEEQSVLDGAAGVALQGHVVEDPHHAPVLGQQPVLGVGALVGDDHGPVLRGEHPVPVVGVEQPRPEAGVVQELRGRSARGSPRSGGSRRATRRPRPCARCRPRRASGWPGLVAFPRRDGSGSRRSCTGMCSLGTARTVCTAVSVPRHCHWRASAPGAILGDMSPRTG